MQNEYYQRKPDKDTFEYWREVVETLEKGRMTKDPFIHRACKLCWESGGQCYNPLKQALKSRPGLLAKAKRNVAEQEEKPFWPPPMKPDEIKQINGLYRLGYVNAKMDMTGLDLVPFTRGFFISGGQGSGKTWPVLRMMDEMLRLPPKERGFNIITIQRIKRDADAFALKYPWFKVLGWRDLRYNMWQVEDWDDPRDKIAAASTIFAGENFLYALSVPPLRYAVKKSYAANGVFEGSKNFPVFSDIFSQIGTYLKDHRIEGYDMKNTIGKVGNRLVDFIEEGEILNCKKGLTTQFFLENDLCLNVIDESEFTVRTTIMSILYDIQRYLQKNPLANPGMRILVIIDEARWLFDITRDNSDYPSNKILETWFTTCRESGFGRIIITQEPGSVSTFVTSNCAFRLSFPVFGQQSIDAIKSLNNLTDDQVAYLAKLAPFGQGIFSYPGFDRAFIIQVPSNLDLDRSVNHKEIDKAMRPFINNLHANLKDSEAAKSVDLNRIRRESSAKIGGLLILDELKQNRFSHYTEIRDKRKLGNKMDEAVEWLESEGLVVVIECKHNKKGHTAKYLALTATAQNSLNILEQQRISPSHFKHTLYLERVKAWIEAQGYKAIKEYSSEGQFKDRIDVYTEYQQNGPTMKIAYEITLTLNSKDIMKNVTKCLNDPFIVDELNIVCETKDDLDRAIQIVAKSEQILPGPLEKITFRTITEFL